MIKTILKRMGKGRNKTFTLIVVSVIGTTIGLVICIIKKSMDLFTGRTTLTDRTYLTFSLSPTLKTTNTLTPKQDIGTFLIRPKDGSNMVFVPAGDFPMGMETEKALAICQLYRPDCQLEWFLDEAPIHTVYLDSFWIDQTEVTNGMYASCVTSGFCKQPVYSWSHTRSDYFRNPDYSNYPVIFVNWFNAASYCEWAGARLPTEAEWEKAARGMEAFVYPWGNKDLSCSLANFWPSFSSTGCYGDTTEVGSFPDGMSPYGAYDMAGNVWEWVADWYGKEYYSTSPRNNPQGPVSGGSRVLRGGSWYWFEHGSLSSRRIGHGPNVVFYGIGFRCVSSSP